MTFSMSNVFDPSTLDARHVEISKLIQDDKVEQAIKRLLDFSRDFGLRREHQHDITLSANKLRVLSDDDRRFGPDDRSRRERAITLGRLLEIADAILDEAKDHLTSRTGGDGPALLSSASGLIRAPVLNDFENARATFIQSRRSKLTSTPECTRKPLFQCSKISRRHWSRELTFELSGISIQLHAGEITGLVGRNGSGKSTLLQLIAGELAIDHGEISYPALADELSWPEIKSQIAYIPQQLRPWSGTIEDNLLYYASLRGVAGRQSTDEVDFVLYRLGIENIRRAKWRQLSGGTQMRCELARSLVWRPKLLILDEPLAPLDIEAQQLFLRDIWELSLSFSAPLGVIISSQHLQEIEEFSSHLLVLSQGTPIYYGSTQELGAKRLSNLFEFTCSASYAQVFDALLVLSVERLEQSGSRFVVHTPRNVSGNDILFALLKSQQIQVEYFKALNHSSRQLLRQGVPV